MTRLRRAEHSLTYPGTTQVSSHTNTGTTLVRHTKGPLRSGVRHTKGPSLMSEVRQTQGPLRTTHMRRVSDIFLASELYMKEEMKEEE